MRKISNRAEAFTDSVIRRMTRISDEYGAINLSQGFPDFDPPKEILDALSKVVYEGPHQYSITFGAKNLRDALARKNEKAIGRKVDPETEVLVTCGSTEAMICTMMAICNPGDKVMVFHLSTRTMAQMRFCQVLNLSIFRWFRLHMTLISH